MRPWVERRDTGPVGPAPQAAGHRSDILFFFAVSLSIYLAFEVRAVLLLIYVSALFAIVLSPAIRFVRSFQIREWRPGRGLAILVLLLSVLGLIVLFLVFALPPIFRDARALGSNWHVHVEELSVRIRQIPFLEKFKFASLQQYESGAVGGAFGLFRGLAGGLVGLFSAIIMIAYFILDGDRAAAWIVSLFPRTHQTRLFATMHKAERRVRHWLVGQLLLMAILGVTSGIFFTIIGVRYSYVLAVLAGAANIVPILGPVVAASVASIVALTDSPGKMMLVLLFYLIYTQVENAFLTPRIMKTTVDLPPLAIFVALIIGGALAGVLGALVAVPTAGLIAVFVEEYLEKPLAE